MPESKTSSPETEGSNAATTPSGAAEKPDKSRIETLADLFREGEPSQEGDASETDANGKPAERQKKGKPKGLKDLAERLELKPEDLYALEIPMSDGKSRTLGQLKDLAAKEGDLSVRELAFEETRSRRESDLMRAQSELRELVAALPKSAVKPEVLEAIRTKHEAVLKRERAQTLEVIPEWNDEAKRTEEIAGIVEHLKGYGFPANYLQSVFDHRTIRYIRDNWRREVRIQKALEQVEAVRPKPTPKSTPNGAAKKPYFSVSGKSIERPRDKLAQVLLR